MAVGVFLIVIIVVVCVLVGAVVLVPTLGDSRRGELREAKRDLTASRQRERIATKALRQIASGTTGNPVFEAQTALDEVENTYTKELD